MFTLLKLVDLESEAEMIPTKFSPYSTYRLSSIAWLGDVPAHWEVRRLKVLVANVVDQTIQRHDREITLALENVENWSGRYTNAESGLSFKFT